MTDPLTNDMRSAMSIMESSFTAGGARKVNHDALLRALRDVPVSDPDAPMREEAAELIERQARAIEVCQIETAKARAMFGAAVGQLALIKGLIHPDGFLLDGKWYKFHPPDELVRDAWEALIRESP